jgi:hypothetical protein
VDSGTPVATTSVTQPPRHDDHISPSRMVSPLVSISWPSLTQPPRYPDCDHWLGGPKLQIHLSNLTKGSNLPKYDIISVFLILNYFSMSERSIKPRSNYIASSSAILIFVFSNVVFILALEEASFRVGARWHMLCLSELLLTDEKCFEKNVLRKFIHIL